MSNVNNQAASPGNIKTETDRKLIEELLLNGYRRAAKSFSTMIGSEVRIDNKRVDIANDNTAINNALSKPDSRVMIVTSIIGALKGESYFLLNADEEQVICDMSRKAFGGGSGIQNELVLKEIDNIISAAVITEFSNGLSLRIYGDVPHLFHRSDSILWGSAISFDNKDDYFIIANANFQFEGHEPISPAFIWRFEKKLVSLIHKPVVI